MHLTAKPPSRLNSKMRLTKNHSSRPNHKSLIAPDTKTVIRIQTPRDKKSARFCGHPL